MSAATAPTRRATAPLSRPRWRLALLAVAWMIAGGAAALRLWPMPDPLPGTPLDGRPAPAFRLTDHRGLEVGLDDLRGRPVVLAFLYANCPDVCRLTAAGLRQAAARLGPRADDVRMVAISVDPAGDDAASVRRFLSRYEMQNRLLYLTGPAAALPQVWRDYHLYADAGRLDAHTDALYLIDKQGRRRSLLTSDFDPDELARALAQLAAE